jgi:hypothetical protein
VLKSDEELEKDRAIKVEETVEILKPTIQKIIESMKQGYDESQFPFFGFINAFSI